MKLSLYKGRYGYSITVDGSISYAERNSEERKEFFNYLRFFKEKSLESGEEKTIEIN